MRILLYSRAFAPQVGGIETVVSSLAHGLAYEGADVTVVTATPGQVPPADSEAPFTLVRRPGLLELAQRMKEADLIHLAGPALVPLVVALLIRRPVVVEHHGLQTACPNGQLFHEPTQSPCPGHFMSGRHWECCRCNAAQGKLHSFRMWLLTFVRRGLCRLAIANVTPTVWLAGVLQLPRTTTIHHGILVAPLRRSPKPAGAPPTFAFLGRLVSTKGVGVLLDATHQLHSTGASFFVKIIGEGPERRTLEARARALGLGDRIVFLGALAEEQLDDTLRDVDVLVMPSLGGEVFGLVAAESMARGCPVIVSALGALTEVVGKTGLHFYPGDSEALAGRLRELIAKPERIASLSSEGRKRVARFFPLDAMIRKHLDLYKHSIRS